MGGRKRKRKHTNTTHYTYFALVSNCFNSDFGSACRNSSISFLNLAICSFVKIKGQIKRKEVELGSTCCDHCDHCVCIVLCRVELWCCGVVLYCAVIYHTLWRECYVVLHIQCSLKLLGSIVCGV